MLKKCFPQTFSSLDEWKVLVSEIFESIKRKDEQIAAQEKELDEQSRLIQKQGRFIEDSNKQLAERDKQLAEQGKRIENLVTLNKILMEQCRNQNASIASLQETLEKAQFSTCSAPDKDFKCKKYRALTPIDQKNIEIKE